MALEAQENDDVKEGDVFTYPLYDMDFYVFEKLGDDLYHAKIVMPFKVQSNAPVFLEIYVNKNTILNNKK